LNAGIKAMQVEDNLNPEELFQFLGGLKASGALLSDRFLHSPVMSLAAELGGGKAGSGINQLVKTVVAPSTAQAKEFLALDMMSKSDFKPPTAHGGFGKRFGHIRADKLGELKPDAHVEGWELAQTDPDLWVNKYLLPRLAQHGITDLPGIIDAVIKLVPTNAANIIEKLITQAPEYAAKAEQYRAAHGIESAKDFDKDAVVQASTLGTALTDLGATLTTPAMARAAGILHDISMSLADLQVTLDAWQTNHPAQAEVAASSVIGGGAAALYFGIARPAIRFLKGLMPGGGAIAAGEAAAAPGAGGGLTGWAAGLGIPAAAAYAGTHLTPAEQAIQDEMQRRQSAGEPEPTHGTFNSWDEILRRIKEELPGGGGMGTGYRIPAPTGSPFSPQAPFFQLPSIDTGSSDARAAGARFAEAFREGVFGPLTGAVDDVLKARAAMLAALTFGASPSIKPTGGDIWTSGTTGINANGTFSDMGVAPIR
jgi:hypothetical protein